MRARFHRHAANATYVKTAIDLTASVLAASACNGAHIQLPVSQKAIQPSTVLKHRRTIEDHLLKSQLLPDQHVALLLERSTDSRQNDKRGHSQSCLVSAFQSFSDPIVLDQQSSARRPVRTLSIGPSVGNDWLRRRSHEAEPGPANGAAACMTEFLVSH